MRRRIELCATAIAVGVALFGLGYLTALKPRPPLESYFHHWNAGVWYSGGIACRALVDERAGWSADYCLTGKTSTR